MKKLEEAFREADSNSSGKITKEQLIKLFAVNEVQGKVLCVVLSAGRLVPFLLQAGS